MNLSNKCANDIEHFECDLAVISTSLLPDSVAAARERWEQIDELGTCVLCS